MEQSILHFRSTHPDWMPSNVDDDDASAYVNRVNDPLRSVNAFRMGVPNRRPSQPFLGFAANSHLSQTSRLEHSRLSSVPQGVSHDLNPIRHVNVRSPRSQITNPDLLREADEDEDEDEPEQKFHDSDLDHSFVTPSQALDEEREQSPMANNGVLGLLNDMYKDTGTGKGIGM